MPRGAHETVLHPRPESLDTVSHQTGRCFLGHLTIRCRMPTLVLLAMMHKLCNDEHYNDWWMGRRLTDSRLVAALQLISPGRSQDDGMHPLRRGWHGRTIVRLCGYLQPVRHRRTDEDWHHFARELLLLWFMTTLTRSVCAWAVLVVILDSDMP